MTSVVVITPPVASSDREKDLVNLTEYLFKKTSKPSEVYGFGLGGEYGYGVDFENSIFMMHMFCWCKDDDCPWCAGCTCDQDSFHYYLDGEEVTYNEQREAFQKELGERVDDDWFAKADEFNNVRCDEISEGNCDYCRGTGMFSVWGGAPPNFWHKNSGLMVRWYKWIGRDMEWNMQIDDATWRTIIDDCVRSVEDTK